MDISKLTVGDVGFSFNKNNLFSKLIYAVSVWKKKLNKNPVKLSHAFIYIGHGLIAEATFSGIVIVNIKKYFDEKHTIEFQTPVIPLTTLEQQLVFNMAAEQAGLIKYGFGQLFVILFNKWFKTKKYDFNQKQMHCSEFVSTIYEKLNRPFTDNESSMNDPIDIYDSKTIKDVEV